MSLSFRAGSLAILLSTFAAQIAHAEDEAEGKASTNAAPPVIIPYHAYAPTVPPASPHHCPPNVYPRLQAPMYPAPVQYTPSWNGGSVITNQAFAPHEMLYAHRYHAMYPPYYHKVKGSWYWTPFGMRQHENWKLEGTEVIVNYRSRFKPFSGFHPPR